MSAPVKVKGPWRPLIDHAGGVTRLAISLQVARSTLNRWIARQAKPSAIAVQAVCDWCKKRKLTAPW